MSILKLHVFRNRVRNATLPAVEEPPATPEPEEVLLTAPESASEPATEPEGGSGVRLTPLPLSEPVAAPQSVPEPSPVLPPRQVDPVAVKFRDAYELLTGVKVNSDDAGELRPLFTTAIRAAPTHKLRALLKDRGINPSNSATKRSMSRQLEVSLGLSSAAV